jgi:hypothetical protein
VVEATCGIPTALLGEKLTVASNMDTYTIREPLGVVAGLFILTNNRYRSIQLSCHDSFGMNN